MLRLLLRGLCNVVAAAAADSVKSAVAAAKAAKAAAAKAAAAAAAKAAAAWPSRCDGLTRCRQRARENA